MLFVRGIEATQEEKEYGEELFVLLEQDVLNYYPWFESDEDTHISEVSSETKEKIKEHMKQISLPMLMGSFRFHGMKVLHYLVMKNMPEEVEFL